jgi:hypothetical protein
MAKSGRDPLLVGVTLQSMVEGGATLKGRCSETPSIGRSLSVSLSLYPSLSLSRSLSFSLSFSLSDAHTHTHKQNRGAAA